MTAKYDIIGSNYAELRKPDRRIARIIERALGSAQTVLNVGAGTGSYEPTGRALIAVEPSREMIRNRRRRRSRRFRPAPTMCRSRTGASTPVTVGNRSVRGSCWRCTAGTAGRIATSISTPAVSTCRSGCRCRRWPTIWFAASVAPRTATPIIRSGPGQMPVPGVTGRYPDFNR